MSRTISAGYVYRQYSTEGVYLADYKSSRAAHEATGVSIGSIARAAHGERRTGTCVGIHKKFCRNFQPVHLCESIWGGSCP